MDKESARNLLERYISGECTSQERLLVESWYNKMAEKAPELSHEPDWEMVGKRIGADLFLSPRSAVVKKWRYYAAAASIILVTGLGAYLINKSPTNGTPSVQYANDILPGSNKAMLTLANGEKIKLDSQLGELATEDGVKITKSDGLVVYIAGNGHPLATNPISFNTIETPRGGQYKVNLPDGTRVWLNASSSIKYPTTFAANQRKVELQGEAYFEVAHNKNSPFILSTKQQNVRVLGTHFNVSAYPDEATINTTLLEGKVAVTGEGINAILLPGEQSVLEAKTNQIRVQNADLESALDWKNGDFVLKNERLEVIMRKVSRWYDVEIVYEDSAPRNLTLGGWVSRSKNISAVLKIIESTGKVHFKIAGRRVVVMQ
jgi:transmembrane sensor